MQTKQLAIELPLEEWQQFEDLSSLKTTEDVELVAEELLAAAFFSILQEWMTSGPYYVDGNKSRGYNVFRQDGSVSVLADTESLSRPHRDYSNASRKAKMLNRKRNEDILESAKKARQEGAYFA